ncbi:MAG: ATP-binding protein [Elusimicrobiota bacterium]
MSLKKENRFRFLKSIKVRLVLGYTVFLMVNIILLLGYFYYKTEKNLIEMSGISLNAELSEAIEMASGRDCSKAAFSNFLSEKTAFQKGINRVGYALFNGEGLLLASSKGFIEDNGAVEFIKNPEAADMDQVNTSRNIKSPVIVLTKKFTDNTGSLFFLQFGAEPVAERRLLNVLLNTFIVGIPLMLMVIVAGGLIITGRVLAPVSRMTDAAAEISIKGSKKMLPVSGSGDELDRLADTFNDVFRRLRDSYDKVVAFTADASHELRLPIAAIKGEAEIILERERDVEEYRETIRSIVEEMDRLVYMINRLLVLARADSPEEYQERQPLEITGLLDKLTEFYRPLAESRNIGLTFEPGEKVEIKGDASKLQKIFSNLIVNAIKYTTDGGNVTVTLESDKKYCIISVKDTGIGIPAEEQEKIFERFYRIDKSRTRKEGGSGLGLSIARAITDEYNGMISVESAPGEGSCFTVKLPVN